MTKRTVKVITHTVQVKVIDTELLEGQVQILLDILRIVMVVPQLRGDEELLSLDDGRDDLLQSSTNFLLVAVDQSTIDVPVAIADGVLDLSRFQWKVQNYGLKGKAYAVLNLLCLAEPSTKPNCRDRSTVREREDLAERHCSEANWGVGGCEVEGGEGQQHPFNDELARVI